MVVMARPVTVSIRARELAGVSWAARSAQAWSAGLGGGPGWSSGVGPGAGERVRPGAAGAGAGDDHLERLRSAAGRRPAAAVGHIEPWSSSASDQAGEVGVVIGAFVAAGFRVIGGASCRLCRLPSMGGLFGKCAGWLMAGTLLSRYRRVQIVPAARMALALPGA